MTAGTTSVLNAQNGRRIHDESCPSSATTSGISAFMEPEASSKARPAVMRTASAMAASSMLSSMMTSAPASSASRAA